MDVISKERSSNLEILRIIAMIIIIAHHYVVNSGLVYCFDFHNISFNMIFLQFVGFGGKMAINSFVLLSAYFMCKQPLIWKKVLKLLLMIYFYKILFYIIFLFTGHEIITLKSLYQVFFYPFWGIEREFTGSFIAFYMLLPFLNKCVQCLSQDTHLKLICYLLFIYTCVSTFLLNQVAWSYIGWYITLYFIASYIRFYPNKCIDNKKLALFVFIISILLIWLSILLVDYIGVRYGFNLYYFMCSDSQKFLALTCGLSMFLLLKNIKIKQSKFINSIAATTFGVLLIHANSDAMRTFLWKDVLKNTLYYDSLWLPLHFILSVISVYILCVIIDYLRICFLEKYLFRRLEKYSFIQKNIFLE